MSNKLDGFVVEYAMSQDTYTPFTTTHIYIYFERQYKDPLTKKTFLFTIIKNTQSQYEIHLRTVHSQIAHSDSFGTVLTNLQTILTNPPDKLKQLLVIQDLAIKSIKELDPRSNRFVTDNAKLLKTLKSSEFKSTTLTSENFKGVQWPGPSNIPFIFGEKLFKDDYFTKPFPQNGVKTYVKTDKQLESEESGLPLNKLNPNRYTENYKINMVQFDNLQLAIDYFLPTTVPGLGGGKGKNSKSKKGGSRKSKKSKKLSRKRRNYK